MALGSDNSWHRIMMHEKNRRNRRNLFPIMAVLTAAGVSVGIFSLLLNLADTVGGAPTRLAVETKADSPESESERENQEAPTLDPGGNTLSASASAPATLPISTVLGAHSAAVVSLITPATDSSFVNSSFASSAPLVITGSRDNTVRIWTGGDNASVAKTFAHNSHINDLALIPQRETEPLRLVTGSGSGEIKLWDLQRRDLTLQNADANEPTTTIADGSGRILSVAANADGRYIASGSGEGALKIWPVEAIAAQKSQTNLRGRTLKSDGPAVSALTFHPTNPDLLISGDAEGTIHLWDIAQDQVIQTFVSSPISVPAGEVNSSVSSAITSLSISPDGRYVASAAGRLIRIWDTQTSSLAQTLSGHDSTVSDIAFSPDGQVLASSSYAQIIHTWNWAEATVFCTLSDEAGPIYAVAFAADGDTLISGSSDGTVRAWDLGIDSNRACIGR